MVKFFTRFSAFAAFVFAIGLQPAYSITIDKFDGSQSVVADGVTPNPPATAISIATAIGGTRTMQTSLAGGALNISMSTQSGFLKHSQDSGVSGQSVVTWDHDLTAGSTAFNGLGGIDLTQDNGTAFVLSITSFDYPASKPINISLVVYDASSASGQKFSVNTQTLNQALSTVDLVIPFASFTKGFGALTAADFHNVGAISMIIDGVNPDVDLTLSNLSTNGECDIVPNASGLAKKDQCGVCNGNNQTCSDCAGVPNGTALPGTACKTGDVGICADGFYDQSCVCKGPPPQHEICDFLDNDCNGQIDDGIVCSDCAGIRGGTTKVDSCGVCGGDDTTCLVCKKRDLTPLQYLLDGGAKKHERLIKKILHHLKRYLTDPASKTYIADTYVLAHTLQVRNWTLSWTLPREIDTCTNSVLCFEKTNLEFTDEYRKHNIELRDLTNQVIAKLKKFEKTATYTKENNALFSANLTLADSVPASTSVCSTPIP